LRAIFDNDEGTLFPNQFVNAKLFVNTLQDVVLVPNSAIQRGAPGTFVYAVKPDQTVAVEKVKVGPTDGQHIAILTGLVPGESVVIDGADRLREGAKITLASAGRSNASTEQPTQPAGQDAAAPGRSRRTQTQDQKDGQSRDQRRSAP